MPSEFALIARYFSRPARTAALGVGDDCALLKPPTGLVLALTTDAMIEFTHFLPDADPRLLGHKGLAVNLSDLAAMGADPRWFLLALALPEADETWIAAFAEGMFALADAHGVELVGGDTTRGPRTITITAIGTLPPGYALRRDAAAAGDDVWLSGATGEAGLGLAHLQGRVALPVPIASACVARLDAPQPRVALGVRLRGVAAAAIDVSDGLLADLGHICAQSKLAAVLDYEALPRSDAVAGCPDRALADECVFAGGDDYELVFTAAPERHAAVEAAGQSAGVAVTRIGRMVAGAPEVRVVDRAGRTVCLGRTGFDHFA